jgi:hypothetical protein
VQSAGSNYGGTIIGGVAGGMNTGTMSTMMTTRICDQLKSRITAASQLQQKLADVLVEQAVA